jgi:hypothetical protein
MAIASRGMVVTQSCAAGPIKLLAQSPFSILSFINATPLQLGHDELHKI